MSGTATWTKGDEGIKTSKDFRVKLEGFEPRSGRVLWTFDAGPSRSLAQLGDPPAITGSNSIGVRDAGGTMVSLNLRDGSFKPMSHIPRWCRAGVSYTV